MTDIANADNNDNINPFLSKLGDRIAEEAPSKYLVSPAAAYAEAGHPRGDLQPVDAVCRGCAQRATYYSMAGMKELRISGMCEPCFDFVMLSPDDRETLDEWMKLVKHNSSSQ